MHRSAIVVYADILCPWAYLAAHRLQAAIDALELGDRVEIDHRALPLELLNERPTPKPILDAEAAALSQVENTPTWVEWRRPSWTYPVSSMLALEAVQLAKRQDLDASAALDLALRRAFFVDSRCITILPEIVDIVRATVDPELAELIEQGLHRGDGRSHVFAQRRDAAELGITTSPTFLMPDGRLEVNPGIAHHWSDKPGRPGAVPIIDADDTSRIAELVAEAARGDAAGLEAVGPPSEHMVVH